MGFVSSSLGVFRCAEADYRPYVMYHLRRLNVLDGAPFDAAEQVRCLERPASPPVSVSPLSLLVFALAMPMVMPSLYFFAFIRFPISRVPKNLLVLPLARSFEHRRRHATSTTAASPTNS